MASVSTDRRRRGSLLVGLLLIALGALLLLTTTGAVSFGIWIEIVEYWPVLLLLTGMEIILARRALLIRAGIVTATLVAVVAVAYFSMPDYDPPEPLRAGYVEPLGSAQRLKLSMAFIGGEVELTSDTSASGSFARLLARTSVAAPPASSTSNRTAMSSSTWSHPGHSSHIPVTMATPGARARSAFPLAWRTGIWRCLPTWR